MVGSELEEQWRDTYIYGDQYEVSNTGKVRNKVTKHILYQQKDGKGYLRTSLSRNNVQVTVKVHRAVAIAFIENPNNLPQVNHKDGDKENNLVNNLEWINNYDNMQHAVKNGLTNHVENSGRKRRAIIGVSDSGEIVRFDSLAEASSKLRICRSNLCNALKGRRNVCGGYMWKYADGEGVKQSD